MAQSHILGFPRIGKERELKRAVESYWSKHIDQQQLKNIAQDIQCANWQLADQAGLSWITVGDFSFYDQVLDMSAMLGVVPLRFGNLTENVDLDLYFRMARGRAPTGQDAKASEMTKWFDTNYHYMVPEFIEAQTFKMSCSKLFEEVALAKKKHQNVKAAIVGPLTYLWLGKNQDADFDKLQLLPSLVEVYQQILRRLAFLKVDWVQIDEPILALDLPKAWKEAFTTVYQQLRYPEISVMLATYFGALEDNLALACQLEVDGLHLDGAANPEEVLKASGLFPKDKVLSVGIIDGRNVWRADLKECIDFLRPLQAERKDQLWVAPSCSLLHCPVDLEAEQQMAAEYKNWLSFAAQKLQEVVLITRALNGGLETIAHELADNQTALQSRRDSQKIHKQAVKKRCQNVDATLMQRKSAYAERHKIQQQALKLPLLPTTTIGSFPQTAEVRILHRDLKGKRLSLQAYEEQIKQLTKQVIEKQEAFGLDVLVHGEMERNDMVEYFGAALEGFLVTEYGWIQSYGTRCVRPPIIYGDIERLGPLTVELTAYAQSLTSKPVKGMLTGPTTIVRWSFVRDDQPAVETAYQIALVLRDEVADLEKAGIQIIQIDEPAFREGMPLRKAKWDDYLKSAIDGFRLASCGVQDKTQIHTHMCYSEFNEIISAIAKLDADVISIEASRSNMKLLKVFEEFKYPNEIGPGVYDIHSPQVPSVESIREQIVKAAQLIPIQQLWVNPDCGLKTRSWAEIDPALRHMVLAAKAERIRFEADCQN